MSLVLDDLGIYYDCHHPSRLERLIREPLEPDESDRARAVIAAWCGAGASKYNGGRDAVPRSLVATFSSAIRPRRMPPSGMAEPVAAVSSRMLDAALAEAPDCKVGVKTHPDVLTGRKAGYFDAATACSDPRIQLCGGERRRQPSGTGRGRLHGRRRKMGFEALIWGRPVRCFGMPFYAGWGMTRG